MRQSGDYASERSLEPKSFRELVRRAVEDLDVERAREEVLPFVLDRRSVEIWSADFFASLVGKIEIV
jgi:hypothetical protein